MTADRQHNGVGRLQTNKQTNKKKVGSKQPTRLYAKGVVSSYLRSKVNHYPRTSLAKIQGVLAGDDTQFYLGKKVAYVYKATEEVKNSKFRVIWSKIRRPHGNSGIVRGKFKRHLPPRAHDAPCRIMLYPSNI